MNGQQQDKVELAVNEAGLATVVGVVVGNVDPADVQVLPVPHTLSIF